MLIGMVVLVAVVMLANPSYAETDPAAVVGLWLFDEGKGDIAKDSSGNGHDGKFS